MPFEDPVNAGLLPLSGLAGRWIRLSGFGFRDAGSDVDDEVEADDERDDALQEVRLVHQPHPPLGPRVPLPIRNFNHFTEVCSGSEEGSYLRLTQLCITQL